jgi:hypothetical protein
MQVRSTKKNQIRVNGYVHILTACWRIKTLHDTSLAESLYPRYGGCGFDSQSDEFFPQI